MDALMLNTHNDGFTVTGGTILWILLVVLLVLAILYVANRIR